MKISGIYKILNRINGKYYIAENVRGTQRNTLYRGKKNISDALAKRTWRFVSPGGEKLEFLNLKRFCREQNLAQSTMSRVSNGLLSQHKGWKRYV